MSTHLPDLDGTKIADRTVGELFSHSGGVIRDSEDGDFWQGMKDFPGQEELLAIARADSSAVIDRNEHFKYSNIGFGLLGLVIEAVTGETFAERVRTAVAGPLGLRDLGGEYEPARRADYAAGHTSLATARERTTIEHVDTHALAAATGCFATAADLTAFFDALMPGEQRLLRTDSVRLQKRKLWEARQGERWYGLGLFVDKIGDTELFGHTGGYPGHITCTLADGADRRVVSVFTNCLDGPATPIARGWYLLQNLARKADHARRRRRRRPVHRPLRARVGPDRRRRAGRPACSPSTRPPTTRPTTPSRSSRSTRRRCASRVAAAATPTARRCATASPPTARCRACVARAA